MNISQDDLKNIISQVLTDYGITSGVHQEASSSAGPMASVAPGIFKDIEGAVQAASRARLELSDLSLEKRRDIIQSIRDIVISNKVLLSQEANRETGLGNVEHKIIKHEIAALNTPGVEDIQPDVFTDEHGLTLIERAPYGVIGAIVPVTNPTSTITSNGIGMIAAGNTVVFNPHPSAKKVSCKIISWINEAIVAAGGPANLMTAIEDPTIESATKLMNHEQIALLVVTGGPGVVKAALQSNKKVIAAGPGNPPCVVDETADLEKAGRDIVNGAGFDNNIICICEKEILVVESVSSKLKAEMLKNGAYELHNDQIKKITDLVLKPYNKPGKFIPNKDYVGKSPKYIAAGIGLDVPENTKILLCEVPQDHPLVWTEQLMPVIPFVRVRDCDTAIDLAFQCEHGYRHTAIMHSLNIDKLSKMARKMNCSLFVKNGPSYAGLGKGGAGYTSYTIASPTGEGLTRARTFTRERRCTLVDHFRIV